MSRAHPELSRALTWVICEARCGQCDWKIGNAPRANERVSADESSRHFLSPCCSASASFSMNAGFQVRQDLRNKVRARVAHVFGPVRFTSDRKTVREVPTSAAEAEGVESVRARWRVALCSDLLVVACSIM